MNRTKVGGESLSVPYLKFRKNVAIIFIVIGAITLFWWVGLIFIIMGLWELNNVKKLKSKEIQIECICPYCQKTIFIYKGLSEQTPNFSCPHCSMKIKKNNNYLETI